MNLYLMLHPAKPFRVKIGISGNTQRRAAQVGGVPVFSGRVWLARELERTLHGLLAPLNSPQAGNGGTEWFWIVNPLTAYAAHLYGFGWWWFVVVPLPFDLLCIALIFWAAQRAAVVAAIASLFYLFGA